MGRVLVERPRPYTRMRARDATGRLSALLTDLDFAPEPGRDAIRLRHCPFLEWAEEYGPLVCDVRLGLMRGALEELGAPVRAERLEPFAEPDVCVARLGRATPAREARHDHEPGRGRPGGRADPPVARDGAGHLVPGGTAEVPRAGRDDPGRAGHRSRRLRALNLAEIALAAAAVLLAVRLGAVRPRLTRRSDRVLAGETDLPRSRGHLYYIGLEAAKVVLLVVLGITVLAA
ncbi:hypothetical protein [Actinomadura sp. NEAU-AAG7]|uniref:hypothetical protein n=1 Tax=Actinomadura sp. NEAU-AAG7 TaxID=2839640 RepID=UPI002032AA37|nr:hypothetical protein [Actinomadura sp. NEAU-AAG7]